MRDIRRMRERYLRCNCRVRLGNLSSSLLRLNNWLTNHHRDDAIIDLMREIAWYMEWNGDMAPAELIDMQREMCRWRRAWPVEQARSILAFRARQISNRILELSGLLDQATHKVSQPL